MTRRRIALALLLVYDVCAAQVPVEALRYKRDLIRNAKQEWGLDAPVATFAAQIEQESAWNPDARSRVGASGLAQFMPATATWISGAYAQLEDNEPLNPQWAIRALVRYDNFLWERVKARNDCDRAAMWLSAYNGGLGWVQRDQALATARGIDAALWWEHVEIMNAGRSAANWKENRGYPRRILRTLEPRYVADGWGAASCYTTRKTNEEPATRIRSDDSTPTEPVRAAGDRPSSDWRDRLCVSLRVLKCGDEIQKATR